MDLFTMIGACLRRWYVTIPVVAIAGWFAFQAYEAVPSVYTTSTSIVVLPSVALEGDQAAADQPPEPRNPYAGSGGARFAAVVLARNINTDAYRTRIGVTDPDITFDASASQQQPIISVEAFAPTPEQVTAALDAVTDSANTVLAEFQVEAGAPDAKLYRIAPAVPADKVQDVTPSRWRSAGAILAVGLIIAAALATALDSVLRRLSERRAERRAEHPEKSEQHAEAGEERRRKRTPQAVNHTPEPTVSVALPTPARGAGGGTSERLPARER